MSWELYLFQLPMGYFNPKESAQGGILVNYLIAETKCPGGEKKSTILRFHTGLFLTHGLRVWPMAVQEWRLENVAAGHSSSPAEGDVSV